jgi:hypothetical protein
MEGSGSGSANNIAGKKKIFRILAAENSGGVSSFMNGMIRNRIEI